MTSRISVTCIFFSFVLFSCCFFVFLIFEGLFVFLVCFFLFLFFLFLLFLLFTDLNIPTTCCWRIHTFIKASSLKRLPCRTSIWQISRLLMVSLKFRLHIFTGMIFKHLTMLSPTELGSLWRYYQRVRSWVSCPQGSNHSATYQLKQHDQRLNHAFNGLTS